MNDELIKRIDYALNVDEVKQFWPVHSILTDCRAEIELMRNELERERMRLAACGVVAMSNTEDSAKKNRQMNDEYKSDSLNCVIRAVDSEMALRAALSRKYVPMTNEQVGKLAVFDDLHHVETPILAKYIRHIEAEVIRRAGLEVGE